MNIKLHNPPIREAVLEFIVEPAISLSEELLPKVHEILGPEFLEAKREFVVNFTLKFDPNSEGQNSSEPLKNPLGAVHFKNDLRSFIVQVREDRIVVSKMSPYRTYADFTDEAFRITQQLTKLFGLQQFRRIGLRYINFIDHASLVGQDSIIRTPGVQLKSELILKQQVTRNQFESADTGYLAVSQIVSPVVDKADGRSYVVIDVDCSRNEPIETSQLDEIAKIVSCLREMKNELFFSNVSGQFVDERMEH